MAVYGGFVSEMLNDWITGKTIKACVMTSAFTWSATATTYADVSATELSDTGYTAGGVAVTGLTVTVVDGLVSLDCDDVTFGTLAADETLGGVVFYADSGTPSTSKLIAVDDMGPVPVSAGTSLTYVIDPTSGFVALSV